jgi:hypothetical protein
MAGRQYYNGDTGRAVRSPRDGRERGYVVLAIVESRRTGEAYEIRKPGTGPGGVYCTCLGWRFSKARPKTCKHLRALYGDVCVSAGPSRVPVQVPLVTAGDVPQRIYFDD